VPKILICSSQKNHKSKVKEHTRRTCYQSIDFEYRTAHKDYEDVILHKAASEVISQDPTSLIKKFIGIHNEDISNELAVNLMRNGVTFVLNKNHPEILVHKWHTNQPIKWISKFFEKQDLLNFIREHKDIIEIDHGQTQYNTIVDDNIVKIHGDPTINHHDWVVVKHQEQYCICHILCFVEVTCISSENVIFPVGNVTGPGLHAICHFVN